MKSSSNEYVGLLIPFFIILHVTFSHQTCPSPDVPHGGTYLPRYNSYPAGEVVTYTCQKNYILAGAETSKCKTNGEWTNPVPFCDFKARIFLQATDIKGYTHPISGVQDDDTSTCFSVKSGEFIRITLDKPSHLYAIRMFLEEGNMNIAITNGRGTCTKYQQFVDTNQWVFFQCNSVQSPSQSVTIKDNSSKNNSFNICEIEVYVREDGCEYPPERRVPNGYFEVTRSLAKLICDDGYETDKNNDRLVCEKDSWIGNRLQCNEILCSPKLNVSFSPGNRWEFVQYISKISEGTRRKLICSDGYEMVGSPYEVVCQKNGVWTYTNATCIKSPEADTKNIIFGSVGLVAAVIIISLFATTIYFVRKQRKEVVVVYNPPTDVSVVSGSESDYAVPYYEPIQYRAPLPSSSLKPSAKLNNENYCTPVDSQNSGGNPTLPADIAFDTMKPSVLYGY